MHAQLSARHYLIATSAAALAAVTACGSSSSPATPPASSPAATSAAAQAAVKADWVAFFSAKTPVTRRVALLQNGQEFASVIRAQASSPLASSATAAVTKVSITSPAEAKVTYSILVDGKPALTKQAGVAVYQDGTWKVGDASFCGLLTLENNGKTAGLPAACRATR